MLKAKQRRLLKAVVIEITLTSYFDHVMRGPVIHTNQGPESGSTVPIPPKVAVLLRCMFFPFNLHGSESARDSCSLPSKLEIYPLLYSYEYSLTLSLITITS